MEQKKPENREEAFRLMVKIFDTTLRDGDQSIGNALSIEEKIEVAMALAWAGVDVIELWFGISRADNGMDEIIDALRNKYGDTMPSVASLARSLNGDIDAAITAVSTASVDKQRIHIFTSGSNEHIFAKFYKQFLDLEEQRELDTKIGEDVDQADMLSWYKEKWFEEKWRNWIRENMQKSMQYAREKFQGQIEWSAEDAVNTDLAFLLDLIRDVIQIAWKDKKKVIINIPDTVGRAEPWEIKNLMYCVSLGTADLVEDFDFEFSFHGHNDTNNAHENAKAAMRWVAKAQVESRKKVATLQIEGCVGGKWERYGNTDWTTVAGNATTSPTKIIDGTVRTNILPNRLYFVSALVDEILKNQQPTAFVWEAGHGSGVHQDWVDKGQRIFGADIYRVYPPETFGVPHMPKRYGPRSGMQWLIDVVRKMGVIGLEKVWKSDLKLQELISKCNEWVLPLKWYEVGNVLEQYLMMENQFSWKWLNQDEAWSSILFSICGQEYQSTINEEKPVDAFVSFLAEKFKIKIAIKDFASIERKPAQKIASDLQESIIHTACHELEISVQGKTREALVAELKDKWVNNIPELDHHIIDWTATQEYPALSSCEVIIDDETSHGRALHVSTTEANLHAVLVACLPAIYKKLSKK